MTDGVTAVRNGTQLLITGTPTQSGTFTYNVSVVGAVCATSALTGTLTVLNPTPSFEANPPSKEIVPPVVVDFTNTSEGANTYDWEFGDGTASDLKSPSHEYANEGAYTVLLTASYDGLCADTISTRLVYYNIVYPNVFTPNGDNYNEYFKIESIGIKSLSGQIFNRWGVVQYEWNDMTQGWNGKNSFTGIDCPEATYYYVVKLVNATNEEIVKKGFVQLIR